MTSLIMELNPKQMDIPTYILSYRIKELEDECFFHTGLTLEKANAMKAEFLDGDFGCTIINLRIDPEQ